MPEAHLGNREDRKASRPYSHGLRFGLGISSAQPLRKFRDFIHRCLISRQGASRGFLGTLMKPDACKLANTNQKLARTSE